MNIYLVQRTDLVLYDEYDSWVVRASDRKEALSLVNWGDGIPEPNQIKVTVIKNTGEPKAILGSFNAG